METNQNQTKPLSINTVISIILAGLFLLLSFVTYFNWKITGENQGVISKLKKTNDGLSKRVIDLEEQFKTRKEQLKTQKETITNLEQTNPINLSEKDSCERLYKHQEQGLTTQFQQSSNRFKPKDSKNFLPFDKLIGFKEEQIAAKDFINYINNKQHYEGIGEVDCPFGILMYGTAGTGKTTLARSLARETGLPFFEVASSMFSQKYKGEAITMVQKLFKEARESAKDQKGAIIFLDECETILSDLTTIENGSEIANVVNQFKTEMTSSENEKNHPIFVIGATNHYHKIDEAIKSRFTYNVEVKTGNFEERKKFLTFVMEKRKNPYTDEAKHYLLTDINAKLDFFNNDMLRANRTLENLLKTAVNTFAGNRMNGEIARPAIEVSDLEKAFKLTISQNPKHLPICTFGK